MKTYLVCGLVWLACLSTQVLGGECCSHCGCQSDCQKVCRLVCETKKVPKIEYSCECEDFCVPGKSDHCKVCDECGHWKDIYTPTCAEVRTRVKLVKKETTTEKKAYKWVVEKVCCDCAAKAQAETKELANSATEKLPPLDGPSVRPASFDPTPAIEPAAEPKQAQAPRSKFDLRGMLPAVLGKR